MKLSGITKENLIPECNDVIGGVTSIDLAGEAEVTLFISPTNRAVFPLFIREWMAPWPGFEPGIARVTAEHTGPDYTTRAGFRNKEISIADKRCA